MVTFTEEIHNGKLHLLCREDSGGFDVFVKLPYAFFVVAIPSEFDMLVYNNLTSIVTKKLFGGMFSMSLILFMKSFLSFIQDGICFTMGCR